MDEPTASITLLLALAASGVDPPSTGLIAKSRLPDGARAYVLGKEGEHDVAAAPGGPTPLDSPEYPEDVP